MYQALYRKYRPQTFADVVGQDAIVQTLINQSRNNKFSHAYLFTGSRGTGKTTCSKLLAKAINCLDPQDGQPCGKCDICKGIENDSLLDIVEMDAASNNGVDNIRALKEEAYFVPAVCKKRVYIIDEAHMLSIPAFNALLKTLEEPPEHVVFILATTEVHKLPVTILSRCQRFDFSRITPQHIADRLLWVAEREQLALSEDAAFLIAKLSDGGMRDALSLLDKCASAGTAIDIDTVKTLCGATDAAVITNMAGHILNKDMSSAITLLDELYQKSVSMSGFVSQLLNVFRNIMLCKVLPDIKAVVPCTNEEERTLLALAAKVNGPTSMQLVSLLTEGVEKMQKSAAQKITAELIVIGMIQHLLGVKAAFAAAPAAVETAPESAAVVNEPVVKEVQTEAPKAQPAAPANGPRLFPRWNDILAVLEDKNKMAYVALTGSKAYLDGNLLLIDCQSPLFLNLMRTNEKCSGDIREAARQVTGQTFRLGPYKKSDAASEQQVTNDKLNKLIDSARASGIDVTIKE